MNPYWQNKKVQGASLVGIALVLGSLVINNLTTPHDARHTTTQPQAVTSKIDREYIAVVDNNTDGIEDWREEFVITAPIIVSEVSSSTVPFTVPETATDQIGIRLFESLLLSKTNNQAPQTTAELVGRTTDKVGNLAQDTLYTLSDVITVPLTPLAIRTYGNTMGQSLINHNVVGGDDELTIVQRALNTNSPAELEKLEPLSAMYKALRDDALNTPVPERFAKNHLDLINAYHTMHNNLENFKLIFDDPIMALLRIKRYQDDATALAITLNTVYRASSPYTSLFTADDPAMVFIAFSN
ncbi:MAG: hypothetical protein RLZZ70_585 [Candidatus Parcubacteria bacterium]|jgi:hypothetical protein